MLEFIDQKEIKNAVSVGIILPHQSKNQSTYSLDELNFLAKTLGIIVHKSFSQQRVKIQPDYYIGKGKLEEIKEYVEQNNIDAVLFDNELNGVQVRNLEKYFNKTIFGRTEIILNIFQFRAQTKEAKLQVRLASLEYMMPRLRNMWTHFSRVQGGIGLRGGEGEKQIELDKRIVKHEINKIKTKLKKVDIQMENRRKRRYNQNQVSLVGYTNAGKSTLFNLLAKSEVFTQDMLFATLGSTVRKVYINDYLTILLNDTVGFINKLPHTLVASFKSTLDEVKNAQLLLHVIDITSPNMENNIITVNNILDEIGASNIPVLYIYNKTDLINENEILDIIKHPSEDYLLISAKEKKGINELKNKINSYFN